MKKQLTKEEKELRRDKIIAITTATIIYGGCISLTALCANKIIDYNTNEKFEANAESLINDCITDDFGLNIEATVEAEPGIAEIYVSGDKLEEVISRNCIKYCEILDEYYTANGENIAYCEATKVFTPVAEEINGQIIYTAPIGATLKDGKCYQTNKLYVIEKDGQYDLPIGYTLDNVIEIIETKPYSELINYDLVIQSGVEYPKEDNQNQELILVKRN